MFAITDSSFAPCVAVSFSSESFSTIQNELSTFGLNPNDWRALHASQTDGYRMVLVHRDDEDLRLAVNIQKDLAPKGAAKIQDLEMIIV